jgi:hypothetical protein
MAAFEYDMVHIDPFPPEDRMDVLNGRGADGWEAYAVSEDNTGWWVFLRRPVVKRNAAGGRRGRA